MLSQQKNTKHKIETLSTGKGASLTDFLLKDKSMVQNGRKAKADFLKKRRVCEGSSEKSKKLKRKKGRRDKLGLIINRGQVLSFYHVIEKAVKKSAQAVASRQLWSNAVYRISGGSREATCQRRRRKLVSEASVCCSSVFSGASLAFCMLSKSWRR